MKNRTKSIMLIALSLVFGAALLSWAPEGAFGGDEAGRGGKAKLGGQLYDNWPKVTGAKPGGSHPLYPAEGKKQGPSSWRCKECHGWDYLGRDGRYASGSHFTGIADILDALKESAGDLKDSLTDKESRHDFSEWLDGSQLDALVSFMRDGVVDVRKYILPDGTVRGNADNGKTLYASHCLRCHGPDGKAMDFKSKSEGIQGVGWLANENPQESLHKIRWGHPGSAMPSAVVDGGLSDDEMADILRYSQSLE